MYFSFGQFRFDHFTLDYSSFAEIRKRRAVVS